LLRVLGQITVEHREAGERILAWHVDVLSDNATVANLASDPVAGTGDDETPYASIGFVEGPNRLGVRGTFMNLAGAGCNTPVELFSIPITSLAEGSSTFTLRPGTGAGNLATDFLVVPQEGGQALAGADYRLASARLSVLPSGGCDIRVEVAYDQDRVLLSYSLCPGMDHTVEYVNALDGETWQALPNAPHNHGAVVDIPPAGSRFYRVRTVVP
jgi:hypothetical protein